jgi:D-3-phosphoglycerate dehydrogenase
LAEKFLIIGGSVHDPKINLFLRERFDVELISTEQFKKLIELPLENTFAIWIHVDTVIRDSYLEALSNLHYILSTTTGLSHIGPRTQLEFGRRIISLKGETKFLDSITSTAEHAWALIMHGTSNVETSIKSVADGNWHRLNHLRESQLSSQTLGIIGFGRLGKIVANYGKAFRMDVLVFDTNQKEMELAASLGFHLARTPTDLVENSDVVTLHASFAIGDTPIINENVLDGLNKPLLLINTARAGLVNEADVIATVRKNPNFRYYTDVLEVEDSGVEIVESPLWQYSKSTNQIVITPHIGGATLDAMHACEYFIAQKFMSEIDFDNERI